MEYYIHLAQKIRREIDYLMQLCDEVYDNNLCEKCPMGEMDCCLKGATVDELWSDVSVIRLAEFIDYSEHAQTEDDLIALAADAERQSEIDRDITER